MDVSVRFKFATVFNNLNAVALIYAVIDISGLFFSVVAICFVNYFYYVLSVGMFSISFAVAIIEIRELFFIVLIT